MSCMVMQTLQSPQGSTVVTLMVLGGKAAHGVALSENPGSLPIRTVPDNAARLL